jgi:hypothetical protein
MTAYDALAELAQRELDLVSAGEMDKLPALRDQRNALVATLPAAPPPSARAALERTTALQERISALLEDGVQVVGAELRKLTHGRTAMRGYAPADERLKLVDRAG